MLLGVLTSDFNVTVEINMGSGGEYKQGLAKLVIPDMHFLEKINTTELASMPQYHSKKSRTCNNCRERDHVAKNCWKNNPADKGNENKESGICFKCDKLGHIAKDCQTHNNKDQDGEETAMLTIPISLAAYTDGLKYDTGW